MSLSIAIVGLPNVGKSTLFNAITDASVLAANYPFATIEPNTGVVPVPDERLAVLAKMYKTDVTIPATVEFVDIAGLVKGASRGEGLGNQFLANIRECDAICHLVRAFESDKIQRADGSTDLSPAADIEIIRTELALADIATIENHLPKVLKQAKADPAVRATVEYLKSVQSALLTGTPPATWDAEKLRGLNLLSAKPVIYVFNVDEAGLTDSARQQALRAVVDTSAMAPGQTLVASARLRLASPRRRPPGDLAPGQASSPEFGLEPEHKKNLASANNVLFICAELESEIRQLSEIEAQELLDDYGVKESGLVQLARAAYDRLGLQSFLTAGHKEVRAWTIPRGATAPQAAGVIHTDFERGFIAAQVVSYPDLIAVGSEAAARAAGKVRTEGRNYVMQPDDVVEFRFNV